MLCKADNKYWQDIWWRESHSAVWFVVQSLSHVWLFVTPWNTAGQASPVLHHLLELDQTHVHQVGDTIQPFHPLPSPSPPAFNLSCIRIFSNESVLCITWKKYWSFSFSISPFNEYSRLNSFSMDRFDLPAVLGTLKSLLQHCISKASILWCSVSLWSSSHIHTDYWENHSFE